MKIKLAIAALLLILIGISGVFIRDSGECERSGSVFGEFSDDGVSICELPECQPGVAGGIGNEPCFSSNPEEVQYWD